MGLFRTLLWLLTAVPFASKAQLINNSPYPIAHRPDSIWIVNDLLLQSSGGSEQLVMESLQGVAAKSGHAIYRVGSKASSLLLEDIIIKDSIPINIDYSGNLFAIFRYFKPLVKGYFLCDLHQPSANAALSLCGPFNAIAVAEPELPMMKQLDIPLITDLRGKTPEDIYETYKGYFNKGLLTYQKETKDLFLGDYSVYTNAFQCYSPINKPFMDKVMGNLNNPIILGWGEDELNTVTYFTKQSGQLQAADYANNLSALSNITCKTEQAKPKAPINTIENVHTVCFIMTDGDNIQFMLNGMITDEKLFANANRGHHSIGWTITPAFSELAPTLLRYYYQHASKQDGKRDNFIASPSGLGYMYPDLYRNNAAQAALLDSFMWKADLNILNVIGQKYKKDDLTPYLQQPHIGAIIYYPYSNYSNLHGRIDWVNNKPIIGARYNLWKGMETPESLAEKLNKESTDVHSEKGYSIIPVHIWSMGVSDIEACIKLLHNNVRVVAPDELVQLVKDNVKH